ncbi:hypothetical protein CFK37_13840 [Virgibacillus phasianinus]|uniref:Uncharacterized protein n=1 Tax=Virgibacillus phasianinus TaxID=2017483 RepID=A0A220U4F4_9BACI|nr:hypothetical protein [Virgibacillus phasianinus]ASK63154.1 hypothetical protein CFK37_13840 [Virgibacillus phasianinus]
MDVLFETLFGNLVVILAIIGGIAKFIKDRNKKDVKKPYSTPKPSPIPSGGGYQQTNYEEIKESTISVPSMQERMDSNKHRAVRNGEHDALAKSTLRKPSAGSNRRSHMRKQITSNLSRQGLVNGVIMYEVLGPPRATKPYKSVIAERRK